MPIIEFRPEYLKERFGIEISEEDLPHMKMELDDVKEDKWYVEVKDTERLDLWSVFGIARELKGLKEIETGIPNYKVVDKRYPLYAYPNKSRPYIAAAVVRGIEIGDEETFKYIIQLQEKITENYGRGRKYVAIGLHNFKRIDFPVYYKVVDENYSFTPLGSEKPYTLKEILEKHPKGKKFKNIVKEYLILEDSKGETLSFPPVINSNYIGRLTLDTSDVFIDVTGTDEKRVYRALNAMVANLLELGGYAETVEVIYADNNGKEKQRKVYKLEKKSMQVDERAIADWLGLDKVNLKILEKLRYNVNGDIVEWLNYRMDIYGFTDIAEDYAIAIGYDSIAEQDYPIENAKPDEFVQKYNDLRRLLLGLGAIELYTTMLTDKGKIRVVNPVSSNYAYVRDDLIHNHLKFLAANQHKEHPIKIFEFDKIYRDKPYWSIVYLELHANANYDSAASKLAFLLRELGLDFEIKKGNHEYFAQERLAVFEGKNFVAYVGEIHPRILRQYGIKYPVSGFELIFKDKF